jgi:hypothetical protein
MLIKVSAAVLKHRFHWRHTPQRRHFTFRHQRIKKREIPATTII